MSEQGLRETGRCDAFPRGNVKADNNIPGQPTLYADPLGCWGP